MQKRKVRAKGGKITREKAKEIIQKHWTPKYGERYWLIRLWNNKFITKEKWSGMACEQTLLKTGLVFRTKKQAQVAFRKIKMVLKET
jgi:hypothetical protein